MKDTRAEKIARQQALYNFLLARGDVWSSMERCTDSISLYPAFFRGYYHNSHTRRLLSEDIAAINRNPVYEKIIIHGIEGIKIGNEAETLDYYKSCKKEAIKKFHLASCIAKKIGKDQQIDLEGEITEAFLK